MQPIATTDEQEDLAALPPAFAVNRQGLPVTLFTLRQKLYLKAKREPSFRFYAVYDRIYRLDVLEAAWALVAANDGAPGVDRVTIKAIGTAPGGGRSARGHVARGVADEAVSASARAAGLHSQSRWGATPVRHSHGA